MKQWPGSLIESFYVKCMQTSVLNNNAEPLQRMFPLSSASLPLSSMLADGRAQFPWLRAESIGGNWKLEAH